MAFTSRADFYSQLLSQARPLLSSTTDPVACMANIAALIYHSLQRTYGSEAVNWCGFYVLREVTFRQHDPQDEHTEDTQSSQTPLRPLTATATAHYGCCSTVLCPCRVLLCVLCIVELLCWVPSTVSPPWLSSDLGGECAAQRWWSGGLSSWRMCTNIPIT